MDKDELGKYFCMAPFTHIAVDSQQNFRPCCMFYPTIYDKRYDSVRKVFDSVENETLRQKMLNGEKIKGCEKCYRDEKLNKNSYRNDFNNRYFKEEYIKNPKIKELELALGNKCNLKCVTCNSYYSSAWEKEDKLLSRIMRRRIVENDRVNENLEDFLNYDFSDLRQIKILGGEPFLYKEYFDFFEKIQVDKINVFLVTNNTIFPNNDWLMKFKQFNNVKINISIDGVHELGEFVRYGLNFKRFTKNFEKWIKFSNENNNVDIIPHLVIHNLNILNVVSTYEWLSKYFDKKTFLSFDILDDPQYLNIGFLPDNVKSFVLQKISNFNYFNTIKEYLNMTKFDVNSMKEFLKYANFLSTRNDLPEESLIIYNLIKQSIKNVEFE